MACVALCAGDPLSATFTVNENVPTADGVPVIAPVEEFNAIPPGSAPALMEYVYGGVPDPAVQLPPAYATPFCAASGTLHVNVNAAGDTTKFVTACVCVCDALSVTFNVNE
jgi:hypothetical protein